MTENPGTRYGTRWGSIVPVCHASWTCIYDYPRFGSPDAEGKITCPLCTKFVKLRKDQTGNRVVVPYHNWGGNK